jgi:hypothetical protein
LAVEPIAKKYSGHKMVSISRAVATLSCSIDKKYLEGWGAASILNKQTCSRKQEALCEG